MMSPYLAVIVFVSSLSACKQRDPDAAGLLSNGTQVVDDVPAGAPSDGTPAPGSFTVTCRPQDPQIQQDLFIVAVRGAVSPDDEAQPVVVSVERRRANAAQQADRLAADESGRGVVRPKGAVFIGFQSGVLTADYAGQASANTHTGLLTLAADPSVNGMPVGCRVTAF